MYSRRTMTRWLALGLMASASVHAQLLSSPIAKGSGTVVPPIPQGTGAGHYGPNSPFPPLKVRGDVVPWSVLTEVKTKNEKNRLLPVFPMTVMALNLRSQRIQGYMMPLESGERQRHFLISSVPMTCAFCVPGGPESMVEVKTKEPVKYTMEPVVVEGKFAVLNDDPLGLYYRMMDAVSVK